MGYKKQKSDSFRQICNSLTPEMGLKRILRKNISNDPSAAEFSELRRELIGGDRPPIPWRPLPEVDVGDPLNLEFSEQEFRMALDTFKKDSVRAGTNYHTKQSESFRLLF